jgi:two-component system phosphate regulon sensor histidine kinase PhoR
LSWSQWPRPTKLIWIFLLASATFVTALSFNSIQREKRRAQADLEQTATILLDTIESFVRNSPQPQPEQLQAALSGIVEAQPGILALLAYDSTGRETGHSFGDGSQFENLVDLLPQLAASTPETVIAWGDRQLVAGRAILGAAEVSGSLFIAMSSDSVTATVARSRLRFALTALFSISLALLSGIALGRSISRTASNAQDGIDSGVGGAPQQVAAQRHQTAAEVARQPFLPRPAAEHIGSASVDDLQSSEDRFQTVVSSISDVVYLAETGEKVAWAFRLISPNVEDLTGYSLTAFQKDPWLWSKLVDREDHGIYRAHLRRFFEGASSEAEYRLIHKAGDANWVRDSGRVESNNGRSATLVYGVVSSITERRLAEAEREQLLRSEREQRLLAESLTELTLALTSQMGLELLLDDILHQAARIVPFTVASISLLEGERLHVVRWKSDEPDLAVLAVAGLAQPAAPYADVTQVLRSGLPVTIPDTGVAPDWIVAEGREWIRSYLAVPIIHHKRVMGLLHLDGDTPDQFSEEDANRLQPLANAAAIAIENARLISDLAGTVAERTADFQSEQSRSETILRNVKDAIVMIGTDGRIEYVNRSFTTLTGYSSDEVLGKPNSLIGPSAGAVDDAADTLSDGQPLQMEIVAKRKDGRSYDAALTIAPVFGVEGRLTGYVASHRDISDSKALERARSQFMSNVSHQLRTPVTNIKLYVDLLQRAGAADQRTKYLEVVRQQSERLETLVQDILELTALDGGEVANERNLTSLKTVIELSASRHRRDAEEAGITLRLAEDRANPLKVRGDEVWLVRALGELIINAITFTPSGGTIDLSLDSQEANGKTWYMVKVADNGPGIAIEEQVRIFDRFYRGRIADAGDIPGTGLGLSIAMEIMRAHGGDVIVESAPGMGATFTLRLPAS